MRNKCWQKNRAWRWVTNVSLLLKVFTGKHKLMCDSQYASDEASTEPVLLVPGDKLFQRWHFGNSNLHKGGAPDSSHLLRKMLCVELAAAVIWVKAAQWCCLSAVWWAAGRSPKQCTREGGSNMPFNITAGPAWPFSATYFLVTRKLLGSADFRENYRLCREIIL